MGKFWKNCDFGAGSVEMDLFAKNQNKRQENVFHSSPINHPSNSS